MANLIGNYRLTVVNGALSTTIGKAFDTIQSKLAGGGGGSCKFYWDYARGGSIINVAARTVAGGAVAAATSEVNKAVKKLLFGGDKTIPKSQAAEVLQGTLKYEENEDIDKYGKISVDGGTYVAYDDWGEQCPDALILYAPTANNISYTDAHDRVISTKNIIWHDTTAIISVSSDKNVILTRVQGRDYSRKELVSNGDINISVSGHITSTIPEVYPASEVQKFRQIMTYKGLVSINNEMLDQWGIDKIVIKSFSLPSNEGKKSVQDYSFEAVGVQPISEANVTEDTVIRIDYESLNASNDTSKESSSPWVNMLKTQLEGLKQNTYNTTTQVTALAESYVDNVMSKW